MNHLLRSLTPALTSTLRLAIIALAIHGALDLARDAMAQEEQQAYMPYAEQSGSLADRVAELEYLLEHFSREGDTVLVSGANLQVVNGTGTTDGEPNGLGNLIIGYNEPRPQGIDRPHNVRSGSHVLVVGMQNDFASYAGIVAGKNNRATGEISSVVGGVGNRAQGDFSSVCGGGSNYATGKLAAVTGGFENFATGDSASVSGGYRNEASGNHASVTGGAENQSFGGAASVTGGHDNKARGSGSSICGGGFNEAAGRAATVAGGHFNKASGTFSAVGGGSTREAAEQYNWRAGDLFQTQ